MATPIQLPVTPDMVDVAQARADGIGTRRNSIRSSNGNWIGVIGEVALASAWGGQVVDSYDYDVLLPNGMRVEVKTKERTVTPEWSYNATVAAANISQECDIYAFMSVIRNPLTVHLCGWVTPKEFYERAKCYLQGEREPGTPFTFTADCWNLRYAALHPNLSDLN